MARPTEYTPARRVAMQAALWGVLAASLGLAAIVDARLGSGSAMSLGTEEHRGQIRFKMPTGWAVSYKAGEDPRIVAVAEELSEPRRSVAIYKEKIRGEMTPLYYFEDSGLSSDIFGRRTPPASVVTVPGASAIQMRAQILMRDADAPETELVICALYPTRGTDEPGAVAVTLWLSDRGASMAADMQLLKQVAASVKVDDGR